MNILKTTIAAVAVITCCLGNQYPAKAQTTCRYRSWDNSTVCSTPGGTYTGRFRSWDNSTVWSGPGGSTTCRYRSWDNSTVCN